MKRGALNKLDECGGCVRAPGAGRIKVILRTRSNRDRKWERRSFRVKNDVRARFFWCRDRPGALREPPWDPWKTPRGLLATIFAFGGLLDDLPVNSGGSLGTRKGPGSDFGSIWGAPGASRGRFRIDFGVAFHCFATR